MNIPRKFLVVILAAQAFCSQAIVAASSTTTVSQSKGLLALLNNRNVLAGTGIAVILAGTGLLLWRRSKLPNNPSNPSSKPDSSSSPSSSSSATAETATGGAASSTVPLTLTVGDMQRSSAAPAASLSSQVRPHTVTAAASSVGFGGDLSSPAPSSSVSFDARPKTPTAPADYEHKLAAAADKSGVKA